MKIFKGLIAIAAAVVAALPAAAVTDKEMDEARAITAKAYLRWANNGSGYLDEVSASSMAELTPKLKEKEKENLKAFMAVSVPKDYASWDKEKLVKYWSVTFFESPGLSAQGKGAKGTVRSKLMKMEVSAPSAAPEPAAAQPVDTAAGNAADSFDPAAATPQDPLADQEAVAKDAAESEVTPSQQEENHTVTYIIVLCILVGVVIWLVVYAANLMKKQPSGSGDDEGDSDELRSKARAAISKKNEEIESLRRRLEEEESRSADIGGQLEKMKLENKRLLAQIERLRGERLAEAEEARADRFRPAERPARPAREEIAEPEQPRRQAPEERAPKAAPQREEKPILREIYLGRANTRGFFVRADRRINSENTVFRLDTDDGLVGTFRVVDDPVVVSRLLSSPEQYLMGACTGEDLNDTVGVRRIVTESAGTAIFEQGYWKVLRKSRIRYE